MARAVACGDGVTVVTTLGDKLHELGGTLNPKDTPLPRQISDQRLQHIRMVTASPEAPHSILIADGKLWILWRGWSSTGTGTILETVYGQRDQSLSGRCVARQIQCDFGDSQPMTVALGDHHVLVCTADGKVWTLGLGDAGQLGLGDYSGCAKARCVTTPTGEWHWPYSIANPAPGGFQGGKIVMVAAGSAHSVALCSKGLVWVWGRNWGIEAEDAELFSQQNTNKVPTLLQAHLFESVPPGDGRSSGSRVQIVVAGKRRTIAITQEGRIFTWGHGLYGELGLGDRKSASAPTEIDATAFCQDKSSKDSQQQSSIVTAAVGSYHTLILTEMGRVFSCGRGDFGVLGLGIGDTAGRNTPVRINSYRSSTDGQQQDPRMIMIAAGRYHSAGVDTDGQLWTWGAGTRISPAARDRVPSIYQEVSGNGMWMYVCMHIRDFNSVGRHACICVCARVSTQARVVASALCWIHMLTLVVFLSTHGTHQ